MNPRESSEERSVRLSEAKLAMLGELSEVIDVDIGEVGMAIRAFHRTRARKAAAIARQQSRQLRGRFRDADRDQEIER